MTAEVRPLVSIIVPVYNVERYVDECLDSIRGQTHERLEIIVVEDCSTDGSLAKLAPHLADPRVRLIQHERNSGLSAARNTGIEAANGEYVLFVDSDDAIAPTLVEACLANALEAGADVVVFDFVAFRDGDAVPDLGGGAGLAGSRQLSGTEYFKLPHFAWLKFIRAELLRDPRLRFPVGYYYEDWPFHWELGFAAREVVHLNFLGHRYRLRADSITGSGGEKLLHIPESQRLVADIVDRHGAADDVRAILFQKFQSGSWFVLTNIESPLLKDALRKVRGHFSYMKKFTGTYGARSLRGYIVRGLLALPLPIAAASLSSLRTILNQVSPARRAERASFASRPGASNSQPPTKSRGVTTDA